MSDAQLRARYRIRTAMLAGVLAFALIVFLLRRAGSIRSGAGPDQLSGLRTFTWIAAAVAGAALVILRLRFASLSPAARGKTTIVAWAIGEFAALFGIAFFMLSGVQTSAAPGLLAFATAMILFPAALRD